MHNRLIQFREMMCSRHATSFCCHRVGCYDLSNWLLCNRKRTEFVGASARGTVFGVVNRFLREFVNRVQQAYVMLYTDLSLSFLHFIITICYYDVYWDVPEISHLPGTELRRLITMTVGCGEFTRKQFIYIELTSSLHFASHAFDRFCKNR